MQEPFQGPDNPAQIIIKREPPYDWQVIAEIRGEPMYAPLTPGPPMVVVRQHRHTNELRVDVYGCDDGLKVTFTNGGTNDARAKWFRDVLIQPGRTAAR